jgi:hypothetical protein
MAEAKAKKVYRKRSQEHEDPTVPRKRRVYTKKTTQSKTSKEQKKVPLGIVSTAPLLLCSFSGHDLTADLENCSGDTNAELGTTLGHIFRPFSDLTPLGAPNSGVFSFEGLAWNMRTHYFKRETFDFLAPRQLMKKHAQKTKICYQRFFSNESQDSQFIARCSLRSVALYQVCIYDKNEAITTKPYVSYVCNPNDDNEDEAKNRFTKRMCKKTMLCDWEELGSDSECDCSDCVLGGVAKSTPRKKTHAVLIDLRAFYNVIQHILQKVVHVDAIAERILWFVIPPIAYCPSKIHNPKPNIAQWCGHNASIREMARYYLAKPPMPFANRLLGLLQTHGERMYWDDGHDSLEMPLEKEFHDLTLSKCLANRANQSLSRLQRGVSPLSFTRKKRTQARREIQEERCMRMVEWPKFLEQYQTFIESAFRSHVEMEALVPGDRSYTPQWMRRAGSTAIPFIRYEQQLAWDKEDGKVEPIEVD